MVIQHNSVGSPYFGIEQNVTRSVKTQHICASLQLQYKTFEYIGCNTCVLLKNFVYFLSASFLVKKGTNNKPWIIFCLPAQE